MKIVLSWFALTFTLIFCSSSAKKESPPVVPLADGSLSALTGYSKDIGLSDLKLPAGFSISIYAEVEDARAMTVSPSGTIFVGNRNSNNVYALQDTDQDGKADKKWIIASGLNMPNGVAFRGGDLYVAEVSRILKFKGIESLLSKPPKPEVVYDQFPTDTWHGAKYIAFGPDNKLYVPVGAPCNVCDKGASLFATITRMNPDGTGLEVFARGVRNTVGFTWHPETGNIWFTDNGRDMLGDDLPPCELNTADKAGLHFGFPFCHGGFLKDPEFGDRRDCSAFTPPAQKLGAHVAPLGLKFYTGNMFPAEYKNRLFIAEHGSWNRSKKNGYRVMMVTVTNGKVTSYEPFIYGWLNEQTQKVSGRPVDIQILNDGSMLVSDDNRGLIYRITYQSR
jgi:glucose/arabinose dehydrogenase